MYMLHIKNAFVVIKYIDQFSKFNKCKIVKYQLISLHSNPVGAAQNVESFYSLIKIGLHIGIAHIQSFIKRTDITLSGSIYFKLW